MLPVGRNFTSFRLEIFALVDEACGKTNLVRGIRISYYYDPDHGYGSPHTHESNSYVCTRTWELVYQLLEVHLGVAKLAEDLLRAVGGLDEGLVVGEG